MGHFDFTRPGGVWSGSAIVATSDMEDLDSKTERAINGDEGGTWAPTSPIVIGGSGAELTGPTTISGEATISDVEQIVVHPGGFLECQSGAVVDFDDCGVHITNGATLE